MEKKSTHFFACLLLLLLFSAFSINTSQAQNIKKHIFDVNGDSLHFLLYKPALHDAAGNTNKYPVIIFLHGIGERNNSGAGLTQLQNWGLPKVIRDGQKMIFTWNGKTDTFVVLSPMCRDNVGSSGPTNHEFPEHYVHSMIQYAKDSLRIDTNRVFLTGLSFGGGGTFRFLSQSLNNTKKLAAAATFCPPAHYYGSFANNVKNANLPFRTFHAQDDAVVHWTVSQNAVNLINGTNPAVRALITLWPTGGHNVYERVYKDNLAKGGYDGVVHLYEWFLGQNKSLPANVLPVASGSDTTVAASPGTATLNAGSSTDADGLIRRYVWKKISAPAGVSLSSVIIANDFGPNSYTTVSGLTTLGAYKFQLNVVDNRSAVAIDTVTITVVTIPPVGFGKAVTFSSTSSRIIAGNVSELKNASAFTLEAQFQYDSTSTSWPYGDATIFRNHITATDRIKLKVEKATRSIHFTVANGTDVSGYTASNVVTHDTWYHVAAVYDGAQTSNANRMKIYINGVQQTLTLTGTIPATTSGSSLACMFGGEPSCCQVSVIDEVRVWDTVLAGTTINSWKNKSLGNCHPNFSRLTLYWPMDNDANPASVVAALGTNYPGIIINGSYVNSTLPIDTIACPPGGGKAVTMLSASGRIQTGDVTQLVNASKFTLEAHIKYDTVNSYWTNVVRKNINGNNRIMFHVGPGDNALYVFVNNGSHSQGATAPNTVSPGTWYHVAAVFDGTQTGNANRLKIYINGVQQTLTFSGTIPATTSSINTAPFIAGGDPICCTIGNIDEVRVWNTALSGSTISEWKDKLLGSCHPDIANLTVYWPLNNNANPAVATAELGTTYTGTISNAGYISSNQATSTSSCGGSSAVLAPYSEEVKDAQLFSNKLYPNPTQGLIQVELNAPVSKSVTIHVIDMYGRYVYRKQTSIVKGLNRLSVNIASLHPGSYFIDVRDGTATLGKYKVVKR